MIKRLFITGIVFLAVLGLSVAFPWMRVPLIMALVYGTAALGVVVLLRAGQISFGHAMYMLISGYTVAFLSEAFPGTDGIVLVLAGTGVSLVTGMVLGLFLVRYRGIFFGMLNLAISMVIFTIVTKFYGMTGGSDGMRVPRPSLFGADMDRAGYEATLLIILLILAVVLVFSVQQFFRSSAGEAMASIKTNEDRLEYLGVSAKKLLWQGYAVSAGLCGLAGAFYGLSQGLVTPEAGYWLKSGELVFISILGGSAHAIGVFVAALLFEFVKMYASILVGGSWQLVLGVTLIAIIYFLPDGLTSLLRKKRQTAEVRS
ncbi:branched-chain amino acid ABC transporter permease [Marinobacter sp. B9-2]|nr:branched-chain amino acid ABC transporter permease [Marinobacter sp. B9-2]